MTKSSLLLACILLSGLSLSATASAADAPKTSADASRIVMLPLPTKGLFGGRIVMLPLFQDWLESR